MASKFCAAAKQGYYWALEKIKHYLGSKKYKYANYCLILVQTGP